MEITKKEAKAMSMSKYLMRGCKSWRFEYLVKIGYDTIHHSSKGVDHGLREPFRIGAKKTEHPPV